MKINKRKLELAMAKMCMNLPDVAKRAGIPYSTVQNAFAGNNVTTATFGHIAKALEVQPEELLEEERN